MKVLSFKAELCDGCGVCQSACARTWFKVDDAAKSAIQIIESPHQPGAYQALFCDQCGECIDVCPTLALKRDKRGVIMLDKNLCVGCLSCVGFCPIAAMFVLPDRVEPIKCVANGKCVKECPTGALTIVDVADAEPTETEKRAKVVAR